MTDIGLIASVAGVTAIAFALSKTLYEAIEDTVNAPADVRSLEKEIRITCLTLNGLLQSLRDGAEDRPEMPEIIEQLRDDLGRLSDIVKCHVAGKGSGAKQVWNQVRWMTKKNKVARLRGNVKSYRKLLSESVLVNSSTQLAAIQRNLVTTERERPYSEDMRDLHYESRVSRPEYRTIDISLEARPELINHDAIELVDRPVHRLRVESDPGATDLPDKKSKTFLRRAITKVRTDRFPM